MKKFKVTKKEQPEEKKSNSPLLRYVRIDKVEAMKAKGWKKATKNDLSKLGLNKASIAQAENAADLVLMEK